jgi:hypothetical protein
MPSMKAQSFDDVELPDERLMIVAIRVDVFDAIMKRLRNLDHVPGYCLTMVDGQPALGLVLEIDGREELICSFKRPLAGPERGLN